MKSDPNLIIHNGWVSNPAGRGTANILETCLFTIFACTWTVQHLNVPSSKDGAWTSFNRKAKWMIATVLLPEFVFTSAIEQYIAARRSVQSMKMLAEEQGKSIFTGHSVREGCRKFQSRRKQHHDEADSKDWTWTLAHGFYANMGGFVVKIKSRVPAQLSGSSLPDIYAEAETFPVVAEQLTFLIKEGYLMDAPKMSREQIEDKSKGDLFTKGITFIQILWLVIEISARKNQNLPITQLEISTVAFASFALVTYCFFWKKPLDVRIPTILEIDDISNDSASELAKSGRCSFARYAFTGDYRAQALMRFPDRIPNDAHDPGQGIAFLVLIIALVFCMIAFGGIHCAAWNYEFPNRIERTLWQAASVVSAALLPIYLGFGVCVGVIFEVIIKRLIKKSKSKAWMIDPVDEGSYWIVAGLYTLARLCLLGEAFASLRALPEGAYHDVDWTRYLPFLQ